MAVPISRGGNHDLIILGMLVKKMTHPTEDRAEVIISARKLSIMPHINRSSTPGKSG